MNTFDLFHSLSDLLWPPRCVACDQKTQPRDHDVYSFAFCYSCAQSLLPVQTPKCPRCAVPFDSGHKDHLCSECLKSAPSFIETHSFFEYGAALAQAISRFKYQPAPWIQKPLGNLMSELLPSIVSPDFVVPIPLHPKRLRQRGFNQSALLATHIAQRLNIPMDTKTIFRKSNNPPQAGKTRADRIKSMKGVFEVRSKRDLKGTKVILFDDVITTTATVEAASKALLGAGCAKVVVISLARSV